MGMFNKIYLRIKSYLDTRKRIKDLQKTVYELTAIDEKFSARTTVQYWSGT